ncbi:hypothetical protein BC835DRAFT_1380215 [Cytidiella melzeri]|nr:hypothetical protein BC835DRAFT_1380215 [Cytidiella melzeri]
MVHCTKITVTAVLLCYQVAFHCPTSFLIMRFSTPSVLFTALLFDTVTASAIPASANPPSSDPGTVQFSPGVLTARASDEFDSGKLLALPGRSIAAGMFAQQRLHHHARAGPGSEPQYKGGVSLSDLEAQLFQLEKDLSHELAQVKGIPFEGPKIPHDPPTEESVWKKVDHVEGLIRELDATRRPGEPEVTPPSEPRPANLAAHVVDLWLRAHESRDASVEHGQLLHSGAA